MKNRNWKQWMKAAGIRAVLAGVLSVLTSVAGLPEVEENA